MKYIEEFYLFVKVVQEGGFSHAAAALGMPTGTISRRISQLEEQLGCSLLHRSTRKLRLTDEGLRYYERLCTPLAAIEQATGEIQGKEADINGVIRLAAPIALSNTILVDMLADFGLHYPEVQFDITQTNDHQHLFDNDRDLVFFNGELPQSLPNALCLGHIEYGLFASPLYLEKMGIPAHPAQLEEHALIYCWPHQHWQLTDRDEQTVQIKRTAKLTVNQTQAAVRAARRHLGIVNAPLHYVHPFLQDEQLVPVLPDWKTGNRPFYMLRCQPQFAPLRVKMFAEFVEKYSARYRNRQWDNQFSPATSLSHCI
ncbi:MULTISPECIES: LysR family transcriptional regulator [Aeromonas]|uniref:LysR family transcriptional regulator n=1 Tax=Aeromonas TaxID=642 RepID=UPI0011B003C6|nr:MULTISPECIES: LysR family transcriptional regulator [Aeromonas]ELM3718776.1 LysR family transcriptional regulator [Aeromonas hydrophila]MBF4797634.1 LysR family transcriptional regulator [Aeromonas hydrophila]MBL0568513.1 LysR family transcriptional regulator [Aeromonas hydrophila]MBL0572304.1 LysR family transcriptional regulator [Aeromonas hydrophila]MBX9561234.1 LysR family transcriptional regulator [Aeromonas hydrophila]